MDIISLQLNNLKSDFYVPAKDIKKLEAMIGQVVKVKVMQNTNEGMSKLMLGNQTIDIKTDLKLEKGQLLTVQVDKAEGKIALKLLTTNQPSTVLDNLLKTALPKQRPLTELIGTLSQVARLPVASPDTTAGAKTSQLPLVLNPLLLKAAQKLVQNLPTADKLGQTQGLKTALLQSGPFFENNLLRAAIGSKAESPLATSSPRAASTATTTTPTTTQTASINLQQVKQDFKHNLLQLVQQVKADASISRAQGERAASPVQTANSNNTGTTPRLSPEQLRNLVDTLVKNPAQNTLFTDKQAIQAILQGALRSLTGEGRVNLMQLAQTLQNPDLIHRAGIFSAGSSVMPQLAAAIQAYKQSVQNREVQNLARIDIIQRGFLEVLESALARILVNQAGQREQPDNQQWYFEVPYRHGDQAQVMQLQVQRRPDSQDESQQSKERWQITLNFTLQEQGDVQVNILLDKQQVAVKFFTENQQAANLFNTQMSKLSTRLEEAGFTLSQLQAVCGMPPREAHNNDAASWQSLIDVKV